MYIREHYDFYDLRRSVWSGAIETLETIEMNGKQDEFMRYMEHSFVDYECPTMTEINDWLWFDWEMIFADLGINEDEDEDEDDEDEGE